MSKKYEAYATLGRYNKQQTDQAPFPPGGFGGLGGSASASASADPAPRWSGPESQAPVQAQVAPGPEIEISNSDHVFEILQNPKYHHKRDGTPAKVIVKCESDTCQPCHSVNPYYQGLAVDPRFVGKILFMRCDVDKMTAPLKQLFEGLHVVPTFFLFCEGRRVDMIVAADRAELNQKLQKLADM